MDFVDVLIPTCRPGLELEQLLVSLERQTVPPQHIRVINTEKDWWEKAFLTQDFLDRHPTLEVRHIRKEEFDHGATRHRGMEESQADYVLCMTQDAVPADEKLIEELIKPFSDERVAVSYGRQLPKKDASVLEKFARGSNYPDQDLLKGKKDIPRMGIKTYLCSNVCAMYRKKVYNELGGFIRHTIFNEDMIFAANAVQAGYLVAYASKARVFHSHNYSGIQQFKRNFDLGVSQADHPEIFARVPSESEGIRMVKQTARYLCQNGKPWLLWKLIWQSGCRYLGYRFGKNYQKLSAAKIQRFTMNPHYWEKR